mmetsp:Transcript_27628/g.87589  ORF Transcript_27628/g.87589 Transcript_27628/m.87589 type:complete len:463 (-) Transcript_27628:56-1444(-)
MVVSRSRMAPSRSATMRDISARSAPLSAMRPASFSSTSTMLLSSALSRKTSLCASMILALLSLSLPLTRSSWLRSTVISESFLASLTVKTSSALMISLRAFVRSMQMRVISSSFSWSCEVSVAFSFSAALLPASRAPTLAVSDAISSCARSHCSRSSETLASASVARFSSRLMLVCSAAAASCASRRSACVCFAVSSRVRTSSSVFSMKAQRSASSCSSDSELVSSAFTPARVCFRALTSAAAVSMRLRARSVPMVILKRGSRKHSSSAAASTPADSRPLSISSMYASRPTAPDTKRSCASVRARAESFSASRSSAESRSAPAAVDAASTALLPARFAMPYLRSASVTLSKLAANSVPAPMLKSPSRLASRPLRIQPAHAPATLVTPAISSLIPAPSRQPRMPTAAAADERCANVASAPACGTAKSLRASSPPSCCSPTDDRMSVSSISACCLLARRTPSCR